MIKVPHQRVVLHPLAHVAPTGGQASPPDQQYAEVRSLSDARLTAAMERQPDRQEPRRRGDTIEALLLAEPPVLRLSAETGMATDRTTSL